MIAHRMDLVQGADSVVVLENGSVVEDDTRRNATDAKRPVPIPAYEAAG
jgi:ABC-type transport system involved in Fe-S cluster assembly fused permease/ATPase subunit